MSNRKPRSRAVRRVLSLPRRPEPTQQKLYSRFATITITRLPSGVLVIQVEPP